MSSAFNIPAGWREAIAEIRNRLNDATPSAFDNSGYRDYAGIVLDAVEEELSALAAAPTHPVDVPGEPVAVSRWNYIAPRLEKVQWTGAGYEYRVFIANPERLEDVGAAIDRLAASVASRAGSEPVMWQSRFFDSTSSVTPGWGKWEEVVPRNPYTDTVEDRVQELRHYIASGYKYELRALYAIAPAAAAEPSDEVLLSAIRQGMGEFGLQQRDMADAILACIRATPRAGVASLVAGEVPKEISTIIENLHTQDNRITDNPLFAVQQKRRFGGVDSDYADASVWISDGCEVDAEEAARLDGLRDTGEAIPDNCQRMGYIDRWEFVTGCLTEQGCKDYITRNGHNLNEPRIYAYGSYRNAEFIAIRKWLMSLRASAGEAQS